MSDKTDHEVMTEHGLIRPDRFMYDNPDQIRVVELAHKEDDEDG